MLWIGLHCSLPVQHSLTPNASKTDASVLSSVKHSTFELKHSTGGAKWNRSDWTHLSLNLYCVTLINFSKHTEQQLVIQYGFRSVWNQMGKWGHMFSVFPQHLACQNVEVGVRLQGFWPPVEKTVFRSYKKCWKLLRCQCFMIWTFLTPDSLTFDPVCKHTRIFLLE